VAEGGLVPPFVFGSSLGARWRSSGQRDAIRARFFA